MSLAFLFLTLPFIVIAKEKPLYDLIREATHKEMLLDEKKLTSVEDVIQDFTVRVFPEKDGPIEREEVERAFKTEELDELCAKNENVGRPEKGRDVQCPDFASEIRSFALREERVRMLGRDLQTIVAGYELPIDGYLGRGVNLPLRYQSIVKLWEAAGPQEEEEEKLLIRTEPMPDELESTFEAVADALNVIKGKSEDEFTAAVWRYRYGYRYVSGVREEFSPPAQNSTDLELMMLRERFPELEAALEELWNALPREFDAIDTPLRDLEIVLFRPPKKYLDLLPDNVFVWAYRERNDALDEPRTGDAGLHWTFPTEPVLPMLIDDLDAEESAAIEDVCISLRPNDPDCPAITGGAYPEPPIEKGGLCSLPLARRGFLCRPLATEKESDGCPMPEVEEDTISLTRCETGQTRATAAGPDVCRSILYRTSDGSLSEGENLDEVCTPNRETTYGNSIGNTMCFVGQCMEKTVEGHRLYPGRSPFTVQDEAFPWDACEVADPTFATFLTPPPKSAVWFPAYRPALLLKRVDAALCQANGLPPRMPTFLCAFDLERRLQLPLVEIALQATSFLDQREEYRGPATSYQTLSAALGARIGTTLFDQYLRAAGRTLGEVTEGAAELLGNLTEIDWTAEMCPRNAAEENGLIKHYSVCKVPDEEEPPSEESSE